MSGRNRKLWGGVLIVIVMVIGILFTLMAVVSKDAVYNLRAIREISERKQARYAAYAGLQVALHNLNKDESWNDDIPWTSLPENDDVRYRVDVENRMTAPPNSSPYVYKGVEVPPGTVYLEVQGWARGASASKLVAGMVGLATKVPPVFNNAVYTSSRVSMSSSATDSWDSSKGPYAMVKILDQPKADKNTLKTYGLRQGTIGSNNIVYMHDSSQVEGDVIVKPPPGGYTPDYLRMDYTSRYTGRRRNLNRPERLPGFAPPFDPRLAVKSVTYADLKPPSQPNGLPVLEPGAYRDFEVKQGEAVMLKSGTYYFRDYLDIAGKVRVNAASGPVIIYIGGYMRLSGSLNAPRSNLVGGNNNNNNNNNNRAFARNVQIYFADESSVSMPGGSGSTGGRKAPRKRVKGSRLLMENAVGCFVVAGDKLRAKLQNSILYGAITARKVSLSKAKVHYDTTLRGLHLAGVSRWAIEGLHEDYRPLNSSVGPVSTSNPLI